MTSTPRFTRPTTKRAAKVATGLAAAAAGTMMATQSASAAAVSSDFIISQPHSVQRACAERILAAQGPSAWTAWSGSLDDMTAESGNSDTAVNASSGAAGYFQIMPSTWADLCGDLGTSGGSAAAPSVTSVSQAPVATAASASAAPSQDAHDHPNNVQAVQQLLVDQGYSVGPEGVDGILGPNTHAGTVAFQSDHGLAADGVPGALTWAALTS